VHGGKARVKAGRLPGMALNGSGNFRKTSAVSTAVRRLLNHLPHVPGTVGGPRLMGVRDAQRASFMQSSRYRTYGAGRHDRARRWRRTLRASGWWLTAFAAAWVALESARAVGMF